MLDLSWLDHLEALDGDDLAATEGSLERKFSQPDFNKVIAMRRKFFKTLDKLEIKGNRTENLTRFILALGRVCREYSLTSNLNTPIWLVSGISVIWRDKCENNPKLKGTVKTTLLAIVRFGVESVSDKTVFGGELTRRRVLIYQMQGINARILQTLMENGEGFDVQDMPLWRDALRNNMIMLRSFANWYGLLDLMGKGRRPGEYKHRMPMSSEDELLHIRSLQWWEKQARWHYEPGMQRETASLFYHECCSHPFCQNIEMKEQPHELRCMKCGQGHWCSRFCQQDDMAYFHSESCDALPSPLRAGALKVARFRMSQGTTIYNIAVNRRNVTSVCVCCGAEGRRPPSMSQCHYCGETNPPRFPCEICRKVVYCSPTCQCVDLTYHLPHCKWEHRESNHALTPNGISSLFVAQTRPGKHPRGLVVQVVSDVGAVAGKRLFYVSDGNRICMAAIPDERSLEIPDKFNVMLIEFWNPGSGLIANKPTSHVIIHLSHIVSRQYPSLIGTLERPVPELPKESRPTHPEGAVKPHIPGAIAQPSHVDESEKPKKRKNKKKKNKKTGDGEGDGDGSPVLSDPVPIVESNPTKPKAQAPAFDTKSQSMKQSKQPVPAKADAPVAPPSPATALPTTDNPIGDLQDICQKNSKRSRPPEYSVRCQKPFAFTVSFVVDKRPITLVGPQAGGKKVAKHQAAQVALIAAQAIFLHNKSLDEAMWEAWNACPLDQLCSDEERLLRIFARILSDPTPFPFESVMHCTSLIYASKRVKSETELLALTVDEIEDCLKASSLRWDHRDRIVLLLRRYWGLKQTQHACVENEELPIQEEFKCPISLTIMTDPVMASDGHSYERAAIEEWLRGHTTSPLTGEILESQMLIPNLTLRNAIRKAMDMQ